MPGTVRNIILDLGNVLVKVDENKFVTGVLGEGVSKQEFDGVFGSGELKNKFETGKISEREFLAAAIKGLNTGITTECLAHHWNSVFSEIPEMKKFVETFLPDKQYFSILL